MVVMDTKHKIQKLKAIFEPGKPQSSYDFNTDRRNHGTGDTKAKQLKVLDKRAQDSRSKELYLFLQIWHKLLFLCILKPSVAFCLDLARKSCDIFNIV